MSTPSEAAFWEEKYRLGEAGWDKGECAPPIRRMLGALKLPRGAKIAVLGAGLGHEAFAAASCGFSVTAIDFAPSAIQGMARRVAASNVSIELMERDLFTLGRETPSVFDAVVEHTCFCAIEPPRRSEYVDVVHQMLKPRGLLLGLFYAHGRPGGPPFDVQMSEVKQLFSAKFELSTLTLAEDSFEARQKQELEFLFVRR